MKLTKNFAILLVLLFSPAIASATDTDCFQHAEILNPQKGAEVDRFMKWLKAHPVEEIESGMSIFDGVYIIDLNNDGTNEYVVQTTEGSIGYLGMYVFARKGDAFELTAGPQEPADNGPDQDFASIAYVNPLSDEEELFTRVCGKIYFSGVSYALPGRESYLWEKDKTISACDSNWINYSRTVFQKLNNEKAYSTAADFLQSVVDQCAKKITPDIRASLDQDVISAREHLKNAKELDFRWLLDPKFSDGDEAIHSHQFPNILSVVVPDVPDWRDRLRKNALNTFDGPANPLQVEVNRYVTLSGCRRHLCEQKILLWVDTKENNGMIAMNSSLATELSGRESDSPCKFLVASRNYTSDHVPSQFWTAFQKWDAAEDNIDEDSCVDFVSADGSSEPVKLPNLLHTK